MYPYNPYQQQMPIQQPAFYPQQKVQVTRVTGENGARAYQMSPGSSILLLDETAPIIYLKTTDDAGYPSISAYSISPYKAPEPLNFESLEERVKRIEEILNGKSDAITVKQKQNNAAGNRAGKADNADA